MVSGKLLEAKSVLKNNRGLAMALFALEEFSGCNGSELLMYSLCLQSGQVKQLVQRRWNNAFQTERTLKLDFFFDMAIPSFFICG